MVYICDKMGPAASYEETGDHDHQQTTMVYICDKMGPAASYDNALGQSCEGRLLS